LKEVQLNVPGYQMTNINTTKSNTPKVNSLVNSPRR